MYIYCYVVEIPKKRDGWVKIHERDQIRPCFFQHLEFTEERPPPTGIPRLHLGRSSRIFSLVQELANCSPRTESCQPPVPHTAPELRVFFYPHPRPYSLILERVREEERERKINRLPLVRREKSISCLSDVASEDWTRNPGMCPEWALKPWPFSLQNDTPTNWATLARAELRF